MDQEDLNLLLLLGYVVNDDELWKRDEDGLEPPPKKKRVWVRDWIQRRHCTTSNTMYKLQCEISEVSP